MLMSEMTTAVSHGLPVKIGLQVKIILLNNTSLAGVKFEHQELVNPDCGFNLAPIDCVAFARV